ncbi:dipeptidase [Falsibacillus albus]|uniref:Membrane dipeptidase n=1 Tax=Falsibacillus albus TaxID=2478915 RepID=A0A3L7JLN1_9BACI|nr:dipeptidase [Falsibacillus albus]RLQ91646.1 membrane dipeptidase [Falsibacillus albus]
MQIFDAHCDVLSQMLKHPYYSFQSGSSLHVTYDQLMETGSKVQCFAIFISPSIHPLMKFQSALEMIDIFHEKILKQNPSMRLVSSRSDIRSLKEGEIGAVLTLEGCEAIENDIVKLNTLYRLGVRSVGLTWNHANCAADGALEPRGSGLSLFGKEIVKRLNDLQIWTDVSHLSEKGFWDVIQLAENPVASHSNSYTLCPHPRNLNDHQIKALINEDSVMGVTFVPDFLAKDGQAGIPDVIRHVEYICSLGGVDHVGFGSDFDGIDRTVAGLSSFRDYDSLINQLLKMYSEDQVKGFLFENFAARFPE